MYVYVYIHITFESLIQHETILYPAGYFLCYLHKELFYHIPSSMHLFVHPSIHPSFSIPTYLCNQGCREPILAIIGRRLDNTLDTLPIHHMISP